MGADIEKATQQKAIKVLMFVDRLLHGGIQTFIWNNINELSADKIHIELLILDDGKHYELEDRMKSKGLIIHQLKGIWTDTITDYFAYIKAVNNFFAEHSDWDIVHIHSSSKALPVAIAAKKHTNAIIIAHAHSTEFQTVSPFKRIIGNIMKKIYTHYCDYYIGCSKEAGIWLFGHRIVASSKFCVMPNGIDFTNFHYNPQLRKQIRDQYEIDNCLVLGNLSRLNKEKNQKFLLQIFAEIKKLNPQTALLLVGDGPDKMELKCLAKKLGIEKQVIFAGYHSNTAAYLNAMDVFVYPSLFEGLSISLLEAQGNGLKCFISANRIPEIVNISGHVEYIALSKSPKAWAEIILASKLIRFDTNFLNNNEFDIRKSAKKLQYLYEKIGSSK